MCELSCCVYVICVFFVGHGVARDYSRGGSGNVQFTSATRSRRHDHNHQSHDNPLENRHREIETRGHKQDSSNNFNDHQPNQNFLDHHDSGDRFQPATTIARQNNDMDKREHHYNEFNQQPTPNLLSLNNHKVFNQNQQENYKRLPHGHDIDFNRQDVRYLPPGRHDQDRQTGQYNSDNPHHDHREKDSDMLERPRLHGQQFEDNPVSHHRQPSHPENQHKTHQHQNLPSDRYDQGRQTNRHHSDNQHHEHREKELTTLEQPRGVHRQNFEENSGDSHRQAGHTENQHETQTRNQWNNKGSVQNHPYDSSQEVSTTESNHINLNSTQRHGFQSQKDVNSEEIVTERSSKKELAQEENLQLNGTFTQDQNRTRSHKTITVNQLEMSHQHSTTTPAPTSTPTIATTHKSNSTQPHPHLTSVVVLTSPDRACADGMAKDFTNKCRPVYQTDKA